MTDYIEFRTQSMKNAWELLCIGGILSAFCIFLIVLIMNIWVTLTLMLPALALPIAILIIRANKVRFGADYIETVTLFGKKKILIKEVNKFGVFFQTGTVWPQVKSQKSIDDWHDDDLFGHKIYLTKNNEFDLDSFRPKGHVIIPYRKELYLRVKQMMETRD